MAEVATRVREAFHAGDRAGVLEALLELAMKGRLEVMFELYNLGEYELMAATRAPDSMHDMRPSGIPGLGTYEGPEGYRQFLKDWTEAFSEAKVELLSVEETELDDRVYWYFVSRQEMTGAGSGVETGFIYAGYGENRDGLVHWSVFDRDLERARSKYEKLISEHPAPRS